MLYTLEALEPGQVFSGIISVPDDAAAQALERALVPDQSRLTVGGTRTRGAGQVTVIDLKQDPPDPPEAVLPPFEERLELLDAWGSADEFWFVLTLLSEAVLRDLLLRYVPVLAPEALALASRWDAPPEGDPAIINWQLRRAWAGGRWVSGWNQAWRLPKPDAWAIAAGSVFVFVAPKAMHSRVAATLQRWEQTGIGERRAEGFGRVLVGHPFHRQEETPR
jgi:CRISPR-associated protein Csx10